MDPRETVDYVVPGGLSRNGSPALLQPTELVIWMHDLVNTDPTSPGRVKPRPCARALYEKGSAEAANWPRMLATTT